MVRCAVGIKWLNEPIGVVQLELMRLGGECNQITDSVVARTGGKLGSLTAMPSSQLHFMFVGGLPRMRHWRGSDDVFFDPDASRDHRLGQPLPCYSLLFKAFQGQGFPAFCCRWLHASGFSLHFTNGI